MFPDVVVVLGAEAVQAARMGTYTKVKALVQGDRPVYQLVGSSNVQYLFYWPDTRSWLIGASYTSSAAGVKSTSNFGAIPLVGWQAFAGGAWASTYPITVATQTFPPATSHNALLGASRPLPSHLSNAPAVCARFSVRRPRGAE